MFFPSHSLSKSAKLQTNGKKQRKKMCLLSVAKALGGTKTKVIKRVITKSQQESGNATYSISLSYGIYRKKNWQTKSIIQGTLTGLIIQWTLIWQPSCTCDGLFFRCSSRAQAPHEVPPLSLYIYISIPHMHTRTHTHILPLYPSLSVSLFLSLSIYLSLSISISRAL